MTSNFSLEDILDRLAPVPLENRRNLEWLHALDKRWVEKLQELKAEQEKYLKRAKSIITEQNLPRDGSVDIHKAIHNEEDYARIKELYDEVLGLADEKMAVANQSHDHIAYALSKLNDDLIKQVAELRERGELPSDLAESFGYKYVDDVNSPYTFESPTPTPSLGFQRSGISSTSNNFGHQGHYDTAASGQSGSRGTIKESDYGQRQHRASQDSYEAAGATSTTVAAGRSHFSASEDGTDAHSGTLLPTGVGAAGGIGADSSLKRLGGAADGGLGLGLGVASGGGGVPGVVSASHLAGSVAVAGGSGNGQTTGPSSRSRNSPVQYHEPISEIIIEDLADGSAEEVFCVCKKVAFGEMVGCEAGEACLGGEWFHLDCVGLKYAPSGTWWCPTCKPKLPKKRRGA